MHFTTLIEFTGGLVWVWVEIDTNLIHHQTNKCQFNQSSGGKWSQAVVCYKAGDNLVQGRNAFLALCDAGNDVFFWWNFLAFHIILFCESDITQVEAFCVILPSLLIYNFLEVRDHDAFLYHTQQNVIHRLVALEIRNENKFKKLMIERQSLSHFSGLFCCC